MNHLWPKSSPPAQFNALVMEKGFQWPPMHFGFLGRSETEIAEFLEKWSCKFTGHRKHVGVFQEREATEGYSLEEADPEIGPAEADLLVL